MNNDIAHHFGTCSYFQSTQTCFNSNKEIQNVQYVIFENHTLNGRNVVRPSIRRLLVIASVKTIGELLNLSVDTNQ